jgi:hypothetical protein
MKNSNPLLRPPTGTPQRAGQSTTCSRNRNGHDNDVTTNPFASPVAFQQVSALMSPNSIRMKSKDGTREAIY